MGEQEMLMKLQLVSLDNLLVVLVVMEYLEELTLHSLVLEVKTIMIQLVAVHQDTQQVVHQEVMMVVGSMMMILVILVLEVLTIL